MSAGLVSKEFRDLRPFLALGAFLLVLDLVEWLTLQVDMVPLSRSFPLIDEAMAAALFLIAYAMGTGLLIRELDDRTLGFLDGLPLSRLRIFGAKVATAGAVLLVYPVGYVLLMAAQHLVSRQSLDHALHPGWLGQAFAMICIIAGAGLALGMLLGFLRSLNWLVLALCAVALTILTKISPGFSVFNPLQLLDVELQGAQWPVPAAGLVTQIVLLLVCTLLAMSLFLAAGDRVGRLQARLNRPLVSASVTLATIGACIAAIAMYAESATNPDPPLDGDAQIAGAKFTPSPPGNAVTDHYSFSYRARETGNLPELLREADRIHAQVADLLGAPPGPRIDVDLSGSAENTAGTAFHDRIRMHQGGQALATLAHETAHVLAGRLAGGERERELSKMAVLNEGLAHWIQNVVTTGSGLAELDKVQAAVVSRRGLLRPELLTDREAFERQVDLSLQYPLGAVLVESMVARYGRDAPGKLLLALGDPDFPRELQGTELWFASFQATGFDLSLVFADYARRLKSWETEFADRIGKLPRPRGSLLRDGEEVGVELRFDVQLPEDWTGVVRFRPDEDSNLTDYSMEYADEEQIAWQEVEQLVGERVCFQPGIRSGEVTIYETWMCLPLDSAAEY